MFISMYVYLYTTSLFYSYLNTKAVKYGPSQMNVNSILWLQCNSICIFVYTYMHFHVYKYMKMCTCIHIQLFVLYMHMCMHMCMYGFISIFMCICKCTYMCIYLYIYLNVYVHVHVHVHVHVIGIACVSPLFVYVRVNTKSNTSHYSQLTKWHEASKHANRQRRDMTETDMPAQTQQHTRTKGLRLHHACSQFIITPPLNGMHARMLVPAVLPITHMMHV